MKFLRSIAGIPLIPDALDVLSVRRVLRSRFTENYHTLGGTSAGVSSFKFSGGIKIESKENVLANSSAFFSFSLEVVIIDLSFAVRDLNEQSLKLLFTCLTSHARLCLWIEAEALIASFFRFASQIAVFSEPRIVVGADYSLTFLLEE